jgi:ligand-binding SRPBCC domain-containing protein
MAEIDLRFRSELSASPERVWQWMTSAAGISRELWPILKMTMPRGLASIADLPVRPGERLFRSWFLLFGFLPIDRSDLTLTELDPGKGFVEESPMLSMKLWRHRRTLEPTAGGTALTDHLTFEPRLARGPTAAFVRALFIHRHAVLQRELGQRGSSARIPG